MPAITSIILGITAATAIAGVGMQIAGASAASSAAKKSAQASEQVAQDETNQSQLQQQQAALETKRMQLQTVRDAQVARAQSLSNSTGQGAEFGSGLQGGYGQIGGQEGTNLLGLAQNMSLSRQYASYNNDIGAQRVLMAQYGGKIASAQGLSSLGGAFMNASSAFGRLGGNFSPSFGGSTSNPMWGGGANGTNSNGWY